MFMHSEEREKYKLQQSGVHRSLGIIVRARHDRERFLIGDEPDIGPATPLMPCFLLSN